jgi:tetratricopeptide (TPR) repeat protein
MNGALAAQPQAKGHSRDIQQKVHLPASAQQPAKTPAAKGANSPQAVFELPNLPQVEKTPGMIEQVAKLEEEGEKCYNRKEYDKAIDKWQQAYGLSLEMNYPEGEGRALTHMCKVYFERGNVIKAKELGENAIELLFNSGDKKSLARARVALAQAYFGLGLPQLAGDQLVWALEAFSSIGNEEKRLRSWSWPAA